MITAPWALAWLAATLASPPVSTRHGLLTERWRVEGPDNSLFGGAAAGGDLNADGLGDFVLTNWYHDASDAFNVGQVVLHLGSPGGVSDTPDWVVQGTTAGESVGFSIAVADVNGDGYDDLLVGTYGIGEARLYLGGPSGPANEPAWVHTFPRIDPDRNTFAKVAAVDVNGDGYDDVVVGSEFEPPAAARTVEAPAVYGVAVFMSSPTGPADAPDWVNLDGGWEPSNAGDVNGDGYGDLAVVARGPTWDINWMWVFYGSPTGSGASPDWIVEGEATFGGAVTSADLNGDGCDELVIGAPASNGSHGAVHLFRGSPTGLESAPVWTRIGEEGEFGASVAVADLDMDGWGDLVVGAATADEAVEGQGAILVFLGEPHGISDDVVTLVYGEEEWGGFGTALVSLGDADGDGIGDLLVGAKGRSDPDSKWDFSHETRAHLLEGCADTTGLDSDGDGLGDGCDLCAGADVGGDADGDGFCPMAAGGLTVDCDDTSALVYPGAPELCDGVDTACAGHIAATELDLDADGYLPCTGDCNDLTPGVGPWQPELCDGRDNNCDGVIPEDELDGCEEAPSAEIPPDPAMVDTGCACVTATERGVGWLGVALLLAGRRTRQRR